MIKEALDNHVKTLDREWSHDRTKTVGASEIGQCARKTHWVKKSGVKDTDHIDTWGARVRGTIMEEKFWEPALKTKFGKNLLYSGADQKTFTNGFLSATPDGLVIGAKRDSLRDVGIKDIVTDCFLVECKSIDPRVNMLKEKSEHEFQVQVQLGLVRELTNYKPEYALVSYTDASFWNEVAEFPICFKPEIFAGAKERARSILEAPSPQDLKPEGWIAGGSECEWCPFTKACGIIRRSVPEKEAAADPQFTAEVSDLCREAATIEETVNKDQSYLREKQQEIKDLLRKKSVRRIPGVVTWSTVKGRQSYDNKTIRQAAIEAGVDVEKFSTVGDPTDRLQIMVSAAPAVEVTPSVMTEQKRNRK